MSRNLAFALLSLITLGVIGWHLAGEEGTAPKPEEIKPMTATQEKVAKPPIDLEVPAKLETVTFAVG